MRRTSLIVLLGSDEGMGRARVKRWGDDITNNTIGHNVSLFMGVVLSLPLVPSLLASFLL